MAHARGGHEVEHALQEPHAGAQDGDEAKLLAVDHRRVHRAQRRFEASEDERQVPCGLVGEQRAEFACELPEFGDRRFLTSHQR